MTKLTCIALLLLCPSIAAAQKKQDPPPPPPGSSITLQIPGLNCTTPAGSETFKILSWAWGASNSSTVTVTEPGKPSLQDLSVVKSFDACSPALLGLVTSGDGIKDVILTQTGSDLTKTTTVQLVGALVSSWSLGSTTTEEIPTEQLSLNFRKICISDGGAPPVCYDPSAVVR